MRLLQVETLIIAGRYKYVLHLPTASVATQTPKPAFLN